MTKILEAEKKVEYIFADAIGEARSEPLVFFEEKYSGYGIFFKPQADQQGDSARLLGSGSHWFWGTLLAKLPDNLLMQLSANGIRITSTPAKADVNILQRLEIAPE